jgi:hypothetical protein
MTLTRFVLSTLVTTSLLVAYDFTAGYEWTTK